MDIPHNFYIPDGKNTRLMDCVERQEFERQTIDNNKGFVLWIPFLEHVFGTLYYVIDKQNGHMMGIVDNQLQGIDCGTQMEPFNLNHLSHMITALEQKRQGCNDSSVPADDVYNKRMWYPSTPQDFRSFDSLKKLKYNGNILTSEERSGLYNDRIKVILEMAESHNVLSRCIYFNPEMTEKYQSNTDRYTKYYTDIIRKIDIYL